MQGTELKAMRTSAGMSQAELGDAIGMSRETIGQMERGQAPIELRTALAVKQVTQDNFVGLRDVVTLHRHAAALFRDIHWKSRPSPDDRRELQAIRGDWSAAGGSLVGEGLLTTASHVVSQLLEPGLADRAELSLFIQAWAAIGVEP